MNSRSQAAFVVARWIATQGYVSEMIPPGPDRAFVQDLVYTVVRRFRPLRNILGELVPRWPKGELEALLLVGGAQLLYMPDVPDFAAVNETVAAAKSRTNETVAKAVNAVLRNLIRRRAEFAAHLLNADLAERESFPNALVSRWIDRYGAAGAEALAKWHNTPADTYLAYPPKSGKGFVLLPHGQRVMDMPGYEEGEFIVQDPATALAIELLDVHPGQNALDFCAAPGGKTVQIAWRMEGKGRLVAQEVKPARLKHLRENLARIRLDWVESVPEVAPDALFDRVLVDTPCSNSGVLRRRPDARWRWTKARLAEMVKQQETILAAAAEHVSPGGLLVYSTCSNEPEENADRIEAFLATHPHFKEIARRESVPHLSGHDGAFACALSFPQPAENMV